MTQRRESAAWKQAYHSPSLHRHRAESHYKKMKKLGIFDLNKTARILDVCCGGGEVLEHLKQEGYQSVTGLDLEPLHSAAFPAVVGGAANLPFLDSQFDAVVCTHSLHHLGGVQAIQNFIGEALRVIQPGGKVYIIDHYDSWHLRWAFGFLQSPLANLFAYGRSFKAQLNEEREYLYDYLDHWSEILHIINAENSAELKIEYDTFFFYAVLEKRR